MHSADYEMSGNLMSICVQENTYTWFAEFAYVWPT